MSALIVGLDISLNGTGFCRSDGASGVLHPPKFKGDYITGMPRLRWVLDSIWNVTEGAELVVIESFLFSAKGASFADLTGLGTLVRFTMWENNRQYVDVNPGTLKVFATGSGAAKKPDMLAAAIKKLGWSGSNDDNVIDSRWLLEMALSHYEKRALTAKQCDAIAKVGWPAISHSSTSSDVAKEEALTMEAAP